MREVLPKGEGSTISENIRLTDFQKAYHISNPILRISRLDWKKMWILVLFYEKFNWFKKIHTTAENSLSAIFIKEKCVRILLYSLIYRIYEQWVTNKETFYPFDKIYTFELWWLNFLKIPNVTLAPVICKENNSV